MNEYAGRIFFDDDIELLFTGSVRKTNTFEYYSILFEDDTEFSFTRFGAIKKVIKFFM